MRKSNKKILITGGIEKKNKRFDKKLFVTSNYRHYV